MTAIDFSAFVNELATVSGETILPFFRTALSIEDKGRPGGFDPVTAADHAAETAMRTLIRRTFPDHGIIGEEYGKERADAEYVWVLDPIDGTKSFISGMPPWGTLIALLRSGEPVFGMMNQPFTRERFSGNGGRAHYRGPTGERDLRVRACTDLAKAVLFTTSPLLMNAYGRETFGRVEKTVRLSRYGGDCYAYCMLAAGHVDLVIETELKPYDVLPLVPIIVGAGGIITTWEGGAPHAGGRIIAAGDKRVHAAAIEGLGRRESGVRRKTSRPSLGRRSLEQRRARHEGVERGQGLDAKTILLHQQLVARARHDEVRAGTQLEREFADRGGRYDPVHARSEDQNRLPDAGGVALFGQLGHHPKRGIRPSHRRRTDRPRRVGLEHRNVAGVAHGIGGEQ